MIREETPVKDKTRESSKYMALKNLPMIRSHRVQPDLEQSHQLVPFVVRKKQNIQHVQLYKQMIENEIKSINQSIYEKQVELSVKESYIEQMEKMVWHLTEKNDQITKKVQTSSQIKNEYLINTTRKLCQQNEHNGLLLAEQEAKICRLSKQNENLQSRIFSSKHKSYRNEYSFSSMNNMSQQ